MDSKQEEIGELKGLLQGKLTLHQRFLIERELKAIISGVRGEEDSEIFAGLASEDEGTRRKRILTAEPQRTAEK